MLTIRRVIITAACLSVLSMPAPALAGSTADSSATRLTNGAQLLGSTPQEALDRYWTPQRRAEAEANTAAGLHRPVYSRERAPGVTGQPEGPAVTIAPTALSSAAKWPGGQYAAPAAMSGKLYFTSDQGQGGVCSATVVSTEIKSVIFTAAHCVHGGKFRGYFSNLWFYPAVKNGFQSSYGGWPYLRVEVLAGWRTNSYPEMDFAGVVLLYNNLAQRVQSRTGALGITWNQPKNYYAYAFGYPGAAPFNGKDLYYCHGATSVSFLNSSVVALPCNMTPGSSGGAWLYNFNPATGFGLVNGVTSELQTWPGGWNYSPYFGNGAGIIYNLVRWG
jgi:V8-like Glu-specific endopeptidase